MLVRSCLVAFLLAAIAGIAAPAASAGTVEGRDDAGDVRSRGLHVDTVPHTPEPDRRVGDITRWSGSYGRGLTVTTRFRSLAAQGSQEFTWFLRTSEDEFDWYVGLVVQPGRDRGPLTVIDPEANQFRCGRVSLDRPGRTLTLRLPASCLGDPDWVKVAHGVRVFTESREHVDDAQRDGVKGIGGWKFGPELAR